MPGKHAPPAERFWRHVRTSDACWEWIASCDDGGYGRFKEVSGASPVKAHRFSWVLHFGEIPYDLDVLHHCDNPRCVRPDHLFIGTPLNNTRDMIRKGRARYAGGWGASPPLNSKLTDEQVRKIRADHAASKVSHRELGRRYGVDHSNITRLLNGKSYAAVDN